MVLFFKAESSIRFGAITRGSNSTQYKLFINLPVIEFHLKFRTTPSNNSCIQEGGIML